MPNVQITTGGIGLDTTDFAKFSKALRKAEPALAKALQVKLRAAGMVVAKAAQSRAADASITIPPSIKVRTSGATVSVVAGGNGVPLAGLMELGNAGATTNQSTFRHPVWGNQDVWVDQKTHPYLLPALTETADAAEALVVEALDEAIAVIVSE